AGERVGRAVRAPRELRRHVAVEACGTRLDAPLVGGDRLADVRVDAADVVAPHGWDAVPRVPPRRVGHRAGAPRQAGEVGQPAGDGLVLAAIVLGDDVRILGAAAAVLHRALERAE